MENTPFVFIESYMCDHDCAFGVWRPDRKQYLLGDGDLWTPDSLRETWPHARFMTWTDVEDSVGIGLEMNKKLKLAKEALENIEWIVARSGSCSSAQHLVDKVEDCISDYKRAVRQVEENVSTKETK